MVSQIELHVFHQKPPEPGRYGADCHTQHQHYHLYGPPRRCHRGALGRVCGQGVLSTGCVALVSIPQLDKPCGGGAYYKGMNYVNTFIAVAQDCKATSGKIPPSRGSSETVAQIQYRMIAGSPYLYTQEDILFESWFARQKLSTTEDEKNKLRDEFFKKDQPCLRTSPLTRTYGWGIVFDAAGRAALCSVDSEEYQQFEESDAYTTVKALRTKRA